MYYSIFQVGHTCTKLLHSIALLYFILNVGPSILQAVKKYAQSTDSRYIHSEVYMYVLVNERYRRKEERSKQGQTNKAKQHSTPKAVTHMYIYMYNNYNRCICMLWVYVYALNIITVLGMRVGTCNVLWAAMGVPCLVYYMIVYNITIVVIPMSILIGLDLC